MKTVQWIALILVIVGAINWGLVALGFNLVNLIFGSVPSLENIVYILVGLSGVYAIFFAPKAIKGGAM